MLGNFRFNCDYVLENDCVLLRPLVSSDLEYLKGFACNEPDLWRYSLISAAGTENMTRYIDNAVRQRDLGRQYAFIVFDKITRSYAGSTRFCEIHEDTQCIQLGYTWYGKRYRGTPLNRHCKLLVLDFAFSTMGMERVEFRVDVDNEIGIKALRKLGCTEEGRLRSCGPNPNGPRRDCYVFSILKKEWEVEIRELLVQKLFSPVSEKQIVQ